MIIGTGIARQDHESEERIPKTMASNNTQRLGLINVYSTSNIGDAAIYASFSYMAQAFDVYWPDNQTELKKHLAEAVLPMPKNAEMGVNLSVGGDIFNNGRERFITKTFINNLRQLLNSPNNTGLFGQSIPRSCHGLSFKLLSMTLKRLAAVTVRDVESHQRLTNAGVNAKLSYDAVLSLTPQHEWLETTRTSLMSSGHDPKKMALLSLRPFDKMYRYNTADCLKMLTKLCQQFEYYGYHPTVLHHAQVDPRDGDAQMIETLKQSITNLKVIDPFTSETGLLPWQYGFAATAIAELVVGIRYHTSIFRMAAGKMPYNLYYSNKGEDLCRRLKVPGCAISEFNPSVNIEKVLETADLTFDASHYAECVRQDFQTTLAAAVGQTSSLNIEDSDPCEI